MSGNSMNPGTTADITAASLFDVLLNHGMERRIGTVSKDNAFRVSVTKDYLVFAAAHFITFAGHRCESLHGHNYRVGVTLEGDIDEESWYVVDFSFVKKLMKRLCDQIDHKVLLPLQNPKLQVTTEGDRVLVAYDGKPRYVFPQSDCALLEIPNTTVEMLAQYLARQARAELTGKQFAKLAVIEIEVEENFGQSAFYREHIQLDRSTRPFRGSHARVSTACHDTRDIRGLRRGSPVVEPQIAISVDSARGEVTITAGPYDLPNMPPDMAEMHMGSPQVLRFDWPVDGGLRGFNLSMQTADGKPLPKSVIHHLIAVNFDRRQIVYQMVERLFGWGKETDPVMLPVGRRRSARARDNTSASTQCGTTIRATTSTTRTSR